LPFGALQAPGSLIVTETVAVDPEPPEGVVGVVGLVGVVGSLGEVMGFVLAPAPNGAPPAHPDVKAQSNNDNAAHAGGSKGRIGTPL